MSRVTVSHVHCNHHRQVTRNPASCRQLCAEHGTWCKGWSWLPPGAALLPGQCILGCNSGRRAQQLAGAVSGARECGWTVELETKVPPKVRNHGEGPY